MMSIRISNIMFNQHWNRLKIALNNIHILKCLFFRMMSMTNSNIMFNQHWKQLKNASNNIPLAKLLWHSMEEKTTLPSFIWFILIFRKNSPNLRRNCEPYISKKQIHSEKLKNILKKLERNIIWICPFQVSSMYLHFQF